MLEVHQIGCSCSDGYGIADYRVLLLNSVTSEELRRLCQDDPELRPLLDQFSPNDGLAKMTDKVLDWCKRRDLFPRLLSAVREYNPAQYRVWRQRIREQKTAQDSRHLTWIFDNWQVTVSPWHE